MTIKNKATGKLTNLRPFAIVALVSQIAIYLLFSSPAMPWLEIQQMFALQEKREFFTDVR